MESRNLVIDKIAKLTNGNVQFEFDGKVLQVAPSSSNLRLSEKGFSIMVSIDDVEGTFDFSFLIDELAELNLRGVAEALTLPDISLASDIDEKREYVFDVLTRQYFLEDGQTDGGENLRVIAVSTWTLDSGDLYYTELTHTLGVQFPLVQVWDTVTSNQVIVEEIKSVDSSTIRVYVRGNTESLVVVMVAGAIGNVNSNRFTMVLTNVAVTAAYNEIILCDATSGAFTVDYPKASVSPMGEIIVKKIDVSANAITLDGNGAEEIEFAATQSLAAQGNYFHSISDGSQHLKIGQG